MTDRYKSLIVGLEHDIREDDAQSIIQAIRMLRGVLRVEGQISNGDDWLAEERAKHELRRKMIDLLEP